MTRRALGTLSLVLFVAAAAVWVRARPSTPTFSAQPLAVLATTSTTTAPTTTAPPPPPPPAPAVSRAPAPPPAPIPPPQRPLTGPFYVATAKVGTINVYGAPDGVQTETVSGGTEAGTVRVFLVKTRVNDHWIEAYMPSRPNGHTGYVRTSDVSLSTVDTQVLVELRYRRLTAWAGDTVIAQEKVAIGTRNSPTPTGLFYVAMLFKSPNPGGAYGPYVFGLSAHSNVYEKFGGGDGMVGVHGTNQPGLIGSAVSHGCVRMYNASITKLVNSVPVGSPLVIVG